MHMQMRVVRLCVANALSVIMLSKTGTVMMVCDCA